MKKLLSVAFLFSLLAAACNVPASIPATSPALENTTLPVQADQFTPAPPTEETVQSVVQATQVLPSPVAPAVVSGPGNVIQFQKNGTYADVPDVIASGASKTYSLNAMKGQIMSVSTFPGVPEGDWGYISIVIKAADGSILCPQAPDTECLFWRGALPSSQDYFVTLTPNGNVPDFVLRVAINPPGKDAQYFQYTDPGTGATLTYPDIFAPSTSVYGNYKSTPQLTLHLIDSKTYEKSNLSEAYIFLSASSNSQLVSTCTDPNQNGGGPEQVVGNQVVNGYTFVHSTSEGAGAGNYYEQDVYRMVLNNVCHEVIFFVHSTNAGNYEPGAVTEFDRNALAQKFLNVFSTFTIK
ncbi:MAG: hypothetical protein K8S20_02435 [Chloroflexi bacterium]|nr:hypothetical protein [Chloroflexota bacterium]